MNITDLLSHAQAIGVIISEEVSNPEGILEIHISIPVKFTSNNEENVSENDNINYTLQKRGNHWVFSSWECVPGPCEDDFFVQFSSREEAIAAVLHFTLGGPTLFGKWIIPTHKHPELTVAQIRRAITEAVTVDKETFYRIEEQRKNKISGNYLFGKTRWEWAVQYQFLTIQHKEKEDVVLKLRRDGQEAYVVKL